MKAMIEDIFYIQNRGYIFVISSNNENINFKIGGTVSIANEIYTIAAIDIFSGVTANLNKKACLIKEKKLRLEPIEYKNKEVIIL